MGIRPYLAQIIGFETNIIPNFNELKETFIENAEDEEKDFLDCFGHLISEDDKLCLLADKTFERLKNQSLYKVFPHCESSAIEIFGIRPIFHYNQSELYASDLLYSAIESGLIKDESRAIKIPYDDWMKYKKMTNEELMDEFNSNGKHSIFEVEQELRYYTGNWGRKYPNHPVYWYDHDFDLALKIFKIMGFDIAPENLDRYMIFEWH